MDFFLRKFFTELNRPKKLNMSFNQLADECLHPLIKYTFANLGCHLELFNLEGNRFTPFAARTLMKAYAISPIREGLAFKFGGLSLSIENLKSAMWTREDDLEAKHPDATLSVTFKRKVNNFQGSMYPKRLPISKADRASFD